MMDKDSTAIQIGKIITNLQTLELILRLLLYELECDENQCARSNFDFHKLQVNDCIEENPLTNYDSLTKLIVTCNSKLSERGISERIDKSLVELRDALAHGRALSLQPIGPFRLLKFSKPKENKVKVTFCVEMTPEWLKYQVHRTSEEVQKVFNVGRKLVLSCFPE